MPAGAKFGQKKQKKKSVRTYLDILLLTFRENRKIQVVGVLRYTRVTPSTATDTVVTEQQWLAIFGAVLYLFLGVACRLKRTEAWASKVRRAAAACRASSRARAQGGVLAAAM